MKIAATDLRNAVDSFQGCNTRKKPRLFLAAYSFPPRVSSGTFRPVKFVKYLPEFFDGEIHVITSDGENCRGDADLEKDIEGRCTVHRILPRFDPGRWKEEQTCKIRNSRGWDRVVQRCRLLAVKLFNGAYHAIKDVLVFPDGKLFWSLEAVKYIEENLKPVPGDVLLTTCPERSLLFAGSKIKNKLPFLRWVVDFRDGWYGQPFNFHTINPLRLFGEKWMERRVFDLSDEVVCASDLIEDVYRARYPLFAEKLSTIFNGFDPSDFEGLEPIRHGENSLNLVYAGHAGAQRSTYILLEAFERMKEAAPDAFRSLKMHFVGGFRDDAERWKKGLEENVRFHGAVAHRTAIRYMLGADLLLLLTNAKEGGSTVYTGKVFEYMRAGAPILVLSPPCGAARLVERCNLGWVVSDADPAAICNKLVELVSLWREGRLTPRDASSLLKKFDRREAARELACVLFKNSNEACP